MLPGITAGLSGNASTAYFAVVVPSVVNAKAAFNFTVYARDARGNNVPSYGGSISFTSTHGGATLPATVKLTGGVGTFSANFPSAGNFTISVSDTVNAGIAGTSAGISTNMPLATSFRVSIAGTGMNTTWIGFSVQAMEGGVATNNYPGVLTFTTSAGNHSISGNSGLTNGAGSFAVYFPTAGTFTVYATDTNVNGASGASNAITIYWTHVAGQAVFYGSQWWTVPNTFHPGSNQIEIYSAGGGGGHGWGGVGGGGGGGGYSRYDNWGIQPGQAFYIIVGGGGAAGYGAAAGGWAGVSDGSGNWYLYATGGTGGTSDATQADNAGGSGATGNVQNHTGGSGQSAYHSGWQNPGMQGGPGGGGAGPGGHGGTPGLGATGGGAPGGGYAGWGGNAASWDSATVNGGQYGGGAGGGAYSGGGASGTGGQGGNSLVIITWQA